MDFKGSYKDPDLDLPSYNDSITTSKSPLMPYPQASYGAQITSQLVEMKAQIDRSRVKNSLLKTIQEEKVLSYLTPHIQEYLASFGETGHLVGTLILVPAAGPRSAKAEPCDYDFWETRHFNQMRKVSANQGDNDTDSAWFWKDEEMAMRLAKLLTPTSKDVLPREEMVSKGEDYQGAKIRRGWLGRKKSTSDAKTSLVVPARKEEKLSAKFVAEEVTFRYEDTMGLYQSERGYCIVLSIQISDM